MRENTLKRRLQAGETVVGTWMNLAEPLVAGLLGRIIGHRTSEYVTTGLLILTAGPDGTGWGL